jgi:hypothetical protein
MADMKKKKEPKSKKTNPDKKANKEKKEKKEKDQKKEKKVKAKVHAKAPTKAPAKPKGRVPKLKKKDIIKPPGSAWRWFCSVHRQRIQDQHPNLKNVEFFTKLSEEWRSMDPIAKGPYQDMAARDRERYIREMAQLSAEDTKKLKGIKRKEKAEKRKKRLVKAASPAYILFSQAYRDTVKKENPQADFREIGHLLGVKWNNMTEEEREPYKEMARKDKERYMHDLAAMSAAAPSGTAEENTGE